MYPHRIWETRLDVAEALEADGWQGDPDNPLELLRHPSGAVWAITNDSGDSGIDGPGGWGVSFPADVPDAVIIAACRAATTLTPAELGRDGVSRCTGGAAIDHDETGICNHETEKTSVSAPPLQLRDTSETS